MAYRIDPDYLHYPSEYAVDPSKVQSNTLPDPCEECPARAGCTRECYAFIVYAGQPLYDREVKWTPEMRNQPHPTVGWRDV